MRELVTFTIAEATPGREAVLANQGVGPDARLSAAVEAAYEAALALFNQVGRPAGMLADIGRGDFDLVYRGEGQNEPSTPVGDIFPRAERLALFAATVGQPVSDRIGACFRSNEFPIGAMLDSIASAAADRLGKLIEARFLKSLPQARQDAGPVAVMRYSPGYCGWHISGQKKLFEYLRPEEIGISLKESYLMTPLKSVSGVLIAGAREMHAFEAVYPFCSRCSTHGCRERIPAVMDS
jgi:hypothetical protein